MLKAIRSSFDIRCLTFAILPCFRVGGERLGHGAAGVAQFVPVGNGHTCKFLLHAGGMWPGVELINQLAKDGAHEPQVHQPGRLQRQFIKQVNGLPLAPQGNRAPETHKFRKHPLGIDGGKAGSDGRMNEHASEKVAQKEFDVFWCINVFSCVVVHGRKMVPDGRLFTAHSQEPA